MKQFGTAPENSITPEAVADSMLDLIQGEQYPGGSCMEVSGSGTRILGTYNIAPPQAAGTHVAEEVLQKNYAPILAMMKKERALL